MRFLGYALALVLGLAAGVAAVAVHRSFAGLLLGGATALVVLSALRLWQPRAATAFAAGWAVTVLVAVSGRAEGDYAVPGDLRGWLLIGTGLLVLVIGAGAARSAAPRGDSGSRGLAT